MHTPISESGHLYRKLSNGHIAIASGAESPYGIEPRRNVKGPKRKPSISDSVPVVGRKRKMRQKSSGWLDGPAAFLVRNQIRMSLALMLMLGAVYLLSANSRPTVRKFYTVSYCNSETSLCSKGFDDGYLVFFWIVLFTFLRSVALDYVFVPLARMGGISTRKARVRFSEQAWLVVYYGSFWGVGIYLMYNSPYWFNTEQLWTDWPLREVSGLFKWYYLAQFAFWLQQIFVLNIEERRKDHAQMFAHHIITCSLLAASYTYHMTRVGHVVLCIMDVIDILLSAAKLLKYLGYSTICDVAFGIFLVAWIIGRHGMYNCVVYSAWKDSARLIQPGCYTKGSFIPLSGQDTLARTFYKTFYLGSDVVCFTKPIQQAFIIFLVALQIITLIWLYMILRVAWRVVQGGVAEDTRSDDEDGDEENDVPEMEDFKKKQQLNRIVALDMDGKANGVAQVAAMNGPARQSGTFNSVMMNGHSRNHLSSQPLGGD